MMLPALTCFNAAPFHRPFFTTGVLALFEYERSEGEEAKESMRMGRRHDWYIGAARTAVAQKVVVIVNGRREGRRRRREAILKSN